MALAVWALVYFVLNQCNNTRALVLQANTSLSGLIRDLVTDVVDKYFSIESSLAVIFCSDTDDFLVHTKPGVAYDSETLASNCAELKTEVDGLVFLTTNWLSSHEHFIAPVQCINKTTLRMKNKKILIIESFVSGTLESFNPDQYLQLFHYLWKTLGLIHLVILPILKHKTTIIPRYLLAYNPFCSRDPDRPGVILKYSTNDDFDGHLSSRLLNMHGYPVDAIMYFPFDYPFDAALLDDKTSISAGTDLMYKWTVESYYNISLVTHQPTDKQKYSYVRNGTAYGVMADVVNNLGELVVNSMAVWWHDSMAPNVQYLWPHDITDVVFIVRKCRHIESWKVFLHIFQWQVWVGIVLYLSIASFISVIFAKYFHNTKEKTRTTTSSAVIRIWKNSLSVSVSKLPRNNPERLLVATSLCFSVIIVTLFLSQMFNLLKSRPCVGDIKTVEDIIDSNLEVLSPYNSTSFSDSLPNNITTRISYIDNADIPYNLSENQAYVFIMDPFRPQSLSKSTKATENLQILEEPAKQFYISHMMPTRSIYFGNFNSLRLRLFQSGFFQKWMREYNRYVREHNYLSEPAEVTSEENIGQLAYNDLTLAFYALYLGLSISVFCFIAELLINRLFALKL